MYDDALVPFEAQPERAGIFLDFDGTLSEIVEVPSDARPLEGAVDLLTQLARRFAVVAIVSGRSAKELLEWMGPEIEVWGLHGAERAIGGRVVLAEPAKPFADLMQRVGSAARATVDELGLRGVLVEDKGVMLGLHYRTADDRDRARSELDRLTTELATSHGLARAESRLAFELRPPVNFSKSQVVIERSREASLRAGMFVGDDLVDLPAFEALDALEREGVAGLRVAVRSDEAPAELLARADVVVDGPAGALEFLARLA